MEPATQHLRRQPAVLWTLSVAAGLFAIILLLQWQTGAYQSEFGAHSDEPAHVVTGLMVRDYLAAGLWQGKSPLAFAEAYYERLPKVALGHYPPAFYVVEGLWLIPVRSPSAVLALMAFLCTVATMLCWHAARKSGISARLALLPAALFLIHPLVRTYTSIVMSDLLLVILCLLAIDGWRKFLRNESSRYALCFGCWAAAAILTKGSGLFLALLPPITIILTGKWQLLKSRTLWLAAIPVLILAAPWMIATRHITAEGMSSVPLSDYVPDAFAFFAQNSPHEFGWIVCCLVLLVVAGSVVQTLRRRPVPEARACHLATLLGLITLYLFVPSGLDTRYLLPLIPSVYILSISLVCSLTARYLPDSRHAIAAAATVLSLIALLEVQRPVVKRYSGFANAIDFVIAESIDPGDDEFIDVLIASGSNGEGAVVAVSAFRPEASLRIHRASKILVDTDWMGRESKPITEAGDETWQRLQELGIEWILVETPSKFPHVALLMGSIPENVNSTEGRYTIRGKNGSETQLSVLKMPQG